MDKWSDYLFLLVDDSSKENEVTGEMMGGERKFVSLPVSSYKAGDWIDWKPVSGGRNECSVYVKSYDKEKVTLQVFDSPDLRHHSHPSYPEFHQEGDEWSSGWYEWGYWSYCHTIRLVKKESVASE